MPHFSSAGAGGAKTFLELTDTPDTYVAQALKIVRVNAAEDALEFVTPSALGFESRARAYRITSQQTIPSGEVTKVQLNAETYDGLGEFDSVTNFRFTAQKAGYYLVRGSVYWVTVVANSVFEIFIRKNGTSVTRRYDVWNTTNDMISTISDIIYLAAENYIELFVYQGTGGNELIHNIESSTFMAIHKLSE